MERNFDSIREQFIRVLHSNTFKIRLRFRSNNHKAVVIHVN